MSTDSRALSASLLLAAAIALVGPAARAEVMTDGPSAQASSTGAAPVLRLAQKTDDDEDGKGRKGKERGKGGEKGKGGDNANKPDANAARQNAIKARQEALKARQDAARTKQDAAKAAQKASQENALKARQDAIRSKQDAQAARAKAIQDKQNASKAKAEAARAQQDAARAKAIKARQDAEAARAKAIQDRQNSFKAQQDAGRAKQEALKANALKEKQDAEAARAKAIQDRQNAIKSKQDAARAKQDALKANALKDRQDAEAARAKAIQEKQDAVKARQDAQRSQQDAFRARQGAARKKAKYDRVKADQEFERARKRAQERKGDRRDEKWTPAAVNRFETLRKGRKTREVGSRDIIIEPDKRVIIRNDNRVFIRHDDAGRFSRKGRRELRRERRKDGLITAVTIGVAGALIYSLMDDEGHVVRRSRRDRDGREYVFFDNRRSYHRHGNFGPEYYEESYIDLPPPVVRIPRDRYIVDYDQASPDDIYDALNSEPIEPLDRGYTLDEVRQNYSILERMRRVDLDAINFEFASWEVPPDEYPKLERLARAIQRVLDRSPSEMFMIEGHTDAVGDDVDNLSLSDRRAESVANILSDNFGIPPENLTTQGYGEEYLKEQTEEPSWINRRVSVRRVTPLLSREGWNDPD